MQLIDALVCSEPGQLQMEQAAGTRGPVPGHALVRPRRVGVCGTDYHIFEGKHPFLQYPRVMGHELAVEVVEAPPGSPVGGRRDLCRQPLPLVRPLHCLPRRKAELLRQHLRARRAPGRRHDRAAFRAAGQSHSRRRPDGR